MVFRQKKGKGKPSSSGKRKLKRNISLFSKDVCQSPSPKRTTTVECKAEESDPAPLSNEETASALDDSGSSNHEERRRPVRKCRLSVDSGPSVSTVHAKPEKSGGDTSERITVRCGSIPDKGESIANYLPCVNVDGKSRVFQPVIPPERTSVTIPYSKKRRRCAKGSRNAPKCPQVVSNAVDNVYNENISPENGAFSEKSASASPIEKKKDEGLQGASNVVSSCQASVSKKLYGSMNLRDLRVMVTRTELPSNSPDEVCRSEKLSAASENAGSHDKAVSLKQKAKNRGKRVNSVLSVSSRESIDSLDRILNSDVEREIVGGGKDTDVESFSKETLSGQRKASSVQNKRRKSLGRVVRRGSDTSEENQDMKEDALSVINKKTVCTSAERAVVGGECLKTANEEAVPARLKKKTPLRRNSRIKSSSTDASSSEIITTDLVDRSEVSIPAHSGSRLSSPDWNLEHETCKMVDTRKLSDVESDLVSGCEKCEQKTQHGHRKAVSKPAKRKKALGRVVRKGSDASEEIQDLSEGGKSGTDVRRVPASAKRAIVGGECVMPENERAVPDHLKNRTHVRRTCCIKSSSPDISSPERTSASVADKVVVSTSPNARAHSSVMPRNSLLLSNTCQTIDTQMLSDVESDVLSGGEKCEQESQDRCITSVSIMGKRRKSLGRVVRKESGASKEPKDLNKGAKRRTDMKKVAASVERAVVGVCVTAGIEKVVSAHLKSKTTQRRTCRIKSSSPELSSSELAGADVVDESATSTSAESGSHTSSMEGNSLSLPNACDPVCTQVLCSEESDPFSGNEECVYIGRRSGNLGRYRIKSESDSDENEGLSSSKTGWNKISGAIHDHKSSVLGKSKNKGLSNSVSSMCDEGAAARAGCKTRFTNLGELDFGDADSSDVQKVKESSILTATKSTQTSFLSSGVDFKVNVHCKKKSVGVQKDMVMASNATQTETSGMEVVDEKGKAGTIEPCSQTKDLQSLMLELLTQLRSVNTPFSVTSNESQVVGEVAPSCGALLKDLVSCVKEDESKSETSLLSAHESPRHRKNASVLMPPNEHNFRKKEISLRSKKSLNTIKGPDCTLKSGDKFTTSEKVDDSVSNVPSSDLSSFLLGLDLMASDKVLKSSDKVVKHKGENKPSNLVPELKHVNSKVNQTNSQHNRNDSMKLTSNRPARKLISSSKRKKSSVSESSICSKGENSVENVTSNGKDEKLGAASEVCISKEHQKSTVALHHTRSNCTSLTSGTSKVSSKGGISGNEDNSVICVENGISDSETGGDLRILWQSKSDEGYEEMTQSKEKMTNNLPDDKTIEIIKEVKRSHSQTGSNGVKRKGRKCISSSVEAESSVDVTEPYHNVSDVTTVKERIESEDELRPAEEGISVLYCIPTQSEPCGAGVEPRTQPLTQDICVVEEEGKSSLNDDTDDPELLQRIEDEDCNSFDDDSDDGDSDFDVISIYGESEYDLLLTGMCSHQQGKSHDVSELEDNPPSSSKFLGRMSSVKKINVAPPPPTESVANNGAETHACGELDSCVADANVPQISGLTDNDRPDVRPWMPDLTNVCSTGDNSIAPDEQASRMNQDDGLNPIVADQNCDLLEIMETSSSGGDKTSPCKNQGAYHDANVNTPSCIPVSEKKFALMPPAKISSLQVAADKVWEKNGSIFKGMCYSFLRRGNCPCQRFQHKYRPNFLQHLEKMDSWSVFVCLIHSLRRKFTSFWDKFGLKVMNILVSRHEESYLLGVLFIYCCTKMSSFEWAEVLKSVERCGITDELSVHQILLYLLINYMHKGKIKNRTAYNEMVDKVARISCYFRETKLLCEVLEVLNRKEFWFTKLTFENLLQRCVAEASTDIGLELCFIVGRFVNRLDDLSHAEPSVLELVNELVKILEFSGEIQLVDSIKGKIMGSTSSNAAMENCNNLFIAPSQQCGTTMTVPSFGEQTMLSDEHGSGVKHVNLKRPNLNVWEDQPSKRPLLSSFPCSGVPPAIDLTHPAFKSLDIGISESDHSLPQYELNLPDISTSTQTNGSKPIGLLSPSKCSHNVPALSVCGKKDGANDDLGANASSTLSYEHLSVTIGRSGKHTVCGHSFKFPSTVPSVENEVSGEIMPGSQLAMDVDKVPRGEPVADEQLSMKSPSLSDAANVDTAQVEFSSEEEEEGCERSTDLNDSPPPSETMNSNVHSSSQTLTYSEVYKKKYNITTSALHNTLNPLAPPKNLSLEEVIKKRQWTPFLLLKFFNPCLGFAEQEKNFVFRLVGVLEEDMPAAFPVMKAVVNSLESKEFRESVNKPKYDLMKKFVSTLVFNVMLKMIYCDMWNEAYCLMNVANDASLPLMASEAYYDKMSQSMKILFLAEICFRCEKMKEAIHLLSIGNLFHQIPSQWKYDSCDADFEVRVTFINSLLCKLAVAGYSDLAPEAYLEVYRCQNGVSESVDLLMHVNKVIICAINGGFCHLAYDVYRTVPDDEPVIPRVTLRALLCGLVSGDIKPLAKPIYDKMCDLGVYPVFQDKHLGTEITIKSFWLKEEIFVIIDNALQVWGPILLRDQPAKYKEHGFSISLLVKYFDVPDDLDVVLKLDDESEKDPVPYCLTLRSNAVQHALEELVFVLEKMLVPAIKYEVISAEPRGAKRVVLNKVSLINHLIHVEVKSEGYH